MTGKPDASPQPMPMDRAILWNPSLPGARASGRAPYPIFFHQEAVIALQEHLKSSPTQAIFGFLIGDLFRDPETGVLYAIIDKTLRLNQAIYGDKTEVVVARLWDRMQQQLEKASGRLLGWYHSHPGQGGSLTTHDVETHEKYFTDPWHVAVLVAAEAGGVTGRFFRAGSADWAKTPLPFYELLQPDSIGKDGKKRSYVTWRNYKAFNPPGAKRTSGPHAAPPPRPAPPPPPPRVEEPPPEDEDEEAEAEEEAEEAPDDGFRIMRSSADDIPVIRTSADDEPAPAPPPPRPVPPPRPSKARPAAPVFVPDEPRPPRPPPPLPPRPTPPPTAATGPDLPWEVTPEALGQMRPAPPLPPEPRRTPTHTFRLLDEEAAAAPAPRARKRKKKSGRWLSRLAVLLVLGGAGAGAYWYFVLRDPGAPPPWAGVVDRVKRLVSRSPASAPPPPASRRAAPRTAAPPPSTRSTRPPPAPAPQAAIMPPRPPVDTTFARFDRLSDTLSRAVRNFQDRAALFASGRVDCATLASGLVAIENLWITYNTERRARIAAFDQRRVSKDQALYAGVDSVESRFEQSGCRRP